MKVEGAETDNIARQLRAKLLSVEQKFTTSEKEYKTAVAMVGQVAVSSSSSSEARTPIRLEVVEEIHKKVNDLAHIV